MDAFADTEVLLLAILPHDEEAPGLVVLGMEVNNEVVEVLVLLLVGAVELQDLRDEGSFLFVKLFSFFLDVQDGSGFRLHLVDVHIIHASDGVRLLLSLGILLVLLLLSHLSVLLLGESQFRGDAELVVASLPLVELF